MRQLISQLIMPLTIFWIIVTISGILYLLKRPKSSTLIILVSLIWLLAISTKPLPNLLVSILEKRSEIFTDFNQIDTTKQVYILTLGAGFSDDKSMNALNQLSNRAQGRLVEGIRLHLKIPHSKLVYSGYGGKSKTTTSETMRSAAISLGVCPEDIQILKLPKNTQAEAQAFYENFGDSIQVILVTDAVHMPRSLYIFKNAGLNPFAGPTNFNIKHGTKKYFLTWMPSASNINNLDMAVHEYVGLVMARIEKNKD